MRLRRVADGRNGAAGEMNELVIRAGVRPLSLPPSFGHGWPELYVAVAARLTPPLSAALNRRLPARRTSWPPHLPIIAGESGLARYLAEIKRFPMLEPQEEYMLAKRWREHDDREAAHKLVTSHLRLVAKIAMGYRGYGLPIGEVISEGNVGLMQAVRRFEPDKGFKLATYAMWWIRASIQEYILRSWSLVKMGTTASQKKLFFNLRKAKSRISALDEGDLRDDQVDDHRHPARRRQAGRDRHEPPPRRRRFAQRAAARGRRGRMAGLARRRQRQPGERARRPRGERRAACRAQAAR